VSDDVPPANTPLQITWNEYESFRSALRALLQLGPEPLAQLARDDIIDYPVPETLEARSVPTPAPVIAFLQFLRSALSQYESVDQLIADLRGLAERDGSVEARKVDELESVLRELLPQSPDEARSRIREWAQYSVNPVLVSVQGAVDLRTVQDLAGELRFVPLAHMRFTFDEPVGGGNDVVVFQTSPEGIRMIERELARVKTLLDRAVSTLGDRAF
jgi:hypothetical protein